MMFTLYVLTGVYQVAWGWEGSPGDDWGGGLRRGLLLFSAGADSWPEDWNPYWAQR